MAHGPPFGVVVAKAHVFKTDARADRGGKSCCSVGRADGRHDVEEGEKVIEIDGLGGELREAEQQAFQQ